VEAERLRLEAEAVEAERLRRMAEEEAEREHLQLLAMLENEREERVQISEQPLMQFGGDFKRIKVKRFVYTPFTAEDAVDEAASSRMHLLSSQERKMEDETLFASLLAKARAHKHSCAAAPGLVPKATRSCAAVTEEERRALSINDTHTHT
jgi:hypothetical protein